RALGRAAAARRDRPRPLGRAALPRARRARERARRVGPGAGPEPARRPAAAPPAHLPVHRPRSRGRETHRGSRGGHVPRQDRGARARARPVRRPPPSLPHVAALRRAGAGPQGPAPAHRVDGRRAVPGAPAARLPVSPALPASQEGHALPHGATGIARGCTRAARGLPLRRAAAVTRRAAMLRDAQLWVPVAVLIAGLLVLWWIRYRRLPLRSTPAASAAYSSRASPAASPQEPGWARPRRRPRW